MKNIFLTLLASCSLMACIENSKNNNGGSREFIPDHDANPVITTAETIAIKNGSTLWKDVSEVRFTFNVDRGARHFERSWIWKPKLDEVVKLSEEDTISYNRASMDSIALKADAGFINDKFWLLAPLNLIWDEGTTFSEKENVIAPISRDTLNQLTVLYGDEGGYTPGDAYDFYYSKDFIIREWVFREGNDSIPSMTNTWEDYQDYKGIKISRMHKDSTGTFKLYFTDISVR